MRFKVHHLLVPLFLSMTGVAGAQGFINGSLVGVQEQAPLTGTYTDSSLMLDASNYTEPGSASGTFSSTVPDGTEVTAYSSNITGLSSTLEPVAISDFLQIGTAGPAIFGSSGTTPNNRFDFNLQTLEETESGTFVGFGTLVDTAGTYGSTAAELQLSFSGASNYSFSVEAVPEPATVTIALAGLGGMILLRRKR
jgi:hypothetical protein